eukprot:3010414-Rhodomonas_salina.3
MSAALGRDQLAEGPELSLFPCLLFLAGSVQKLQPGYARAAGGRHGPLCLPVSIPPAIPA